MERNVAVIGAGAAGLVSARELLRQGLRVVVFEQGSRIGGTWVYDDHPDDELNEQQHRSIHSSVYKSLRTNLPRESMGFLDYPFAAAALHHGDDRRFPGHEEVLAYLHSFSDRFELRKHVRLSTRVMYAGLMDNAEGNWLVKSINSSGSEHKEIFEAIVVCNGHYSQPRIAQIPGIEKWPGRQYHSHNYRTPEIYKDQTVAVIGNSASGHDISRDIADVCKHVYWCARSFEDLISPLKQTNISKHLMIVMADEDGTLHFEDGTSAAVDVILHCTGYLYEFPFLDTGNYISVADNRVGPLYKHVFPPALAPLLSFVGLPSKIIPFPIFELQAKWIASVLGGSSSLPSAKEMEDDIFELYDRLQAQGVPKRHTHVLDMQMFEYAKWLIEASGSPGVEIEEWRKELFQTTRSNRKLNPDGYRDEWFDDHLYKKVIEIQLKQAKTLKLQSRTV